MDPKTTDERWGDETADLLRQTAERSIDYLAGLPERRVHPLVASAELRPMFAGSLPDDGIPAADVVSELVAAGERGTVASAGPRYFGFVIGGSLPAALAGRISFVAVAGSRLGWPRAWGASRACRFSTRSF